ncbi:MAG: EAL domain-containing protein [Firmicutes bacterium]|nr:EAL domain-containing protein [Bacillota bacterium]
MVTDELNLIKNTNELFVNNLEAIFVIRNEKIISCNDYTVNLYGYGKKEELIGCKFNKLLVDKIDMDIDERKKFNLIQKRKNGENFFSDTTIIPSKVDGIDYYITIVRDITNIKKISDMIEENNLSYQNFFNKNPIAMLLIDYNTLEIKKANNSAINYYGYSKSELNTFKLSDITTLDEKILLKGLKGLKKSEKESLHVKQRLKNNSIRDTEIFSIPLKLNNEKLCCIMIKDVTKINKLEERVSFLQYTDSLTKLSNKDFLLELLEEKLKKKINQEIYILFIDLDDFKKINDNLGYKNGNYVLEEFTNRLKKSVSNNSFISRFGGDEFIVLINKNDSDNKFKNIVRDIFSSMEKPFIIEDKYIYMNISIGVSKYPEHGKEAMDLIRNAEVAMNKAKEGEGNRVEIYTSKLNDKIRTDFIYDSYLRYALEYEELYLNYQPIINTKSGEIIGAEALLRWENDDLGNISPSTFIPIAEKNGTIIKIGKWVLKKACRQNKRWQDLGYKPIFISVNVSALQLKESNFYKTVKEILDETKLDSKYLELEITETVYMSYSAKINENLKRIKELGVSLAIDDFGTGYSSFSKLRKESISKLKIDKSFVDDVCSDTHNKKITSAIISMSKSLQLEVVAEGVETEKHLKFLKGKSCDMYQGYLFSKPLEGKSFEKYLKK